MRIESLSRKSAWSDARVAEFLEGYRAPLRLAVQDGSGFPLICSLWFIYEENRIRCATTRDSKVVRCLEANSKCAFELAPNEPPYFGVRGRARATIRSDGAIELLGTLIERYLGTRDTELGRWLLGRSEEEVVIELEIDWMTSWDYSDRMSDSRTSE